MGVENAFDSMVEGVEVPKHHAEMLTKMGIKARKEYYRSVRQGLTSVGALACAEFVERATKVPELGANEVAAAKLSRRLSVPQASAAVMKARRAAASRALKGR
jgi:hypothetical protein